MAEDFQEYCSALIATAVYNVNRREGTRFFQPDALMMRRRARNGPEPPMRYAKPGERPPSRNPPGTRDDVIERFDNYAARIHRRKHG